MPYHVKDGADNYERIPSDRIWKKENTYEYCSITNIQDKWRQTPDISIKQFNIIDWKKVDKALRSQSRRVRIFITKHVSQRQARRVEMKRHKERVKDNCPRCEIPHETK
mmetsp:Transcript_19870/g.24513  ORF Transcript_19870/g.24513 Transcript_19870/m.24513 type:complete len:109 (+) Transcript_19870:398-724(+)